MKPSTGLVAVVDALGTADYSLERVGEYLDALDELLKETTKFAEDQAARFIAGFKPTMLNRFVFQDSVILVYECPNKQVRLDEILWFGHVLRTFLGGAFHRKVFFRGAWAVGDLHLVSPKTNRVLGPAVRDAARWFEAANWIGMHATPRTSLYVQALVDGENRQIDFVLVDYPVPMKSTVQPVLKLKAVNWPKHLHLRYPGAPAQAIRSLLESNLVADAIPPGVERKHFNTREFFDYVVGEQHLEASWTTRATDPNAKHPADRG